ncbi:MAG: HAD-IIB family hydrolase [Gammaproteobacteria bacterium]|nr:HAD-IIB family hydrolase [Gammaproteobacteria bacterium]
MNRGILLCVDLDRTVLPNGPWDESPQARPLLRLLAQRDDITLAYVSGRHKALLTEAIEEYGIPVPDFAIGDVGTTIYAAATGDWRPWDAWEEVIAPDWNGLEHDALVELCQGFDGLTLQEKDKQGRFKLSYYTPKEIDRDGLINRMGEKLHSRGVLASLIWSVDEEAHTGLLDVLPAHATKIHAIRFLMEQRGFAGDRTVFAGDSGNDLPALTSGLQAVLVRNASDEVREEALGVLNSRGLRNQLYLAKGGFLGMNGNYAAGVLEGLAHFLPETLSWMEMDDR